MRGLLLALVLAVQGAWGAVGPHFDRAVPTWARGRETEMNLTLGYRAEFQLQEASPCVLSVAASAAYRVRFNGTFVGSGPARSGAGFFRVDVWNLRPRSGANVLQIEVMGGNCDTFCWLDRPSFLQAEVRSGEHILAATGRGRDFAVCEMPRVQRVNRVGIQRGFAEVWSVDDRWRQWTAGGNPYPALEAARMPDVRLAERIVPYAEYRLATYRLFSGVEAAFPSKPVKPFDGWRDRPRTKRFSADEMSVDVSSEVRGIVYGKPCDVPQAAPDGTYRVPEGRQLVFSDAIDNTGFIRLRVTCRKPGRLVAVFDEILVDGKVNPSRIGPVGAVYWDVGAAGTYDLETFEPYTLKYLAVMKRDGDFAIEMPTLREYKYPTLKSADFRTGDRDLDAVYQAAVETYRQNAMDSFMDCPGRERGGWLCDAFFQGRTEKVLVGSSNTERLFWRNFAEADDFPDIPKGMLPMVYPGNHYDGIFIPNWALWGVLQLSEYLGRSGDRETVEMLKGRMLGVVEYLWKFRNADGLLEKLPGWIIIGWSRANDFVQDVNYPSNMLWAGALEAVARMYGMPEYAQEARRVRETVRRQSWNGKWFVDNAVRGSDGRLVPSGETSETCQYYAFFFDVAAFERDGELWHRLVRDFGPSRDVEKTWPKVYPSNSFIGHVLRMDLMARAGNRDVLLSEIRERYAPMAARTGTLWEHSRPSASCCHGFMGYVAALMRMGRISQF